MLDTARAHRQALEESLQRSERRLWHTAVDIARARSRVVEAVRNERDERRVAPKAAAKGCVWTQHQIRKVAQHQRCEGGRRA